MKKTLWSMSGLVLVACSLPAATIQYQVSVNSTGIGAIPGYIEVQFDQANAATSASATARVTGFTSTGFTFDDSKNAATSGVTGTLRGAQLLVPNDSSGANYFDQGVSVFGTSFRFLVDFTGPATTGAGSDPSEFLVFLYDSSFNPILGPLASGEVANITINPNGSTTPMGSSVATVTPVAATPEPATFAFMALAGGLLVIRWKRR